MNKRWMLGPLWEEEQGAPQGSGNPPADGADDELEQLRRRLDASERKTNALEEQAKQKPVVQPPQAVQPSQQQTVEDLNKKFWTNPAEMVAQMANVIAEQKAGQVYGAIQSQQGDLLINQAKEVARKADPELFDALEVHIGAKMQTVPDQYKVNPTVWVNAFNTVKGEHMDKVMELKGKRVQPTGSGDGPRPPSHRQPPAAKVEKLSDDELKFARKLKLTEEQYRQGKEFYGDQEKMWKGVVTFDSTYEARDSKYDKKETTNGR